MLQSNPRWLLLLLVGFLLAGCESKVSQCQKIKAVHNNLVEDTKKLSTNVTKNNLEPVIRFADTLAQGAQAMKAIEVGDPKLKEIKDQFMVMYQNSSQVTKQILDSQRQKKNAEVAKGQERLRQVASPEKNLVDGINNYCRSSSGQ